MAKYLIINADDFGMSKRFNEAILELAEERMISSTTAMVGWIKDDQDEQVEKLIELAKKNNISIGLHLEFLDNDFSGEADRQLEKFISIFSLAPSHIDIHKAHGITESFPSVAELCRRYGFPLRNSGEIFEGIRTTPDKAFFCSNHTFPEIEKWIRSFKEGKCYEAMFHPGKYDPESRSSLNKEREADAESIRKLNPVLDEEGVAVISWADFSRLALEK